MLHYSKTEEGYIKVVCEEVGWTQLFTTTTLYDLKNKRSKHNNGEWYDMPQSAIDWVNKYYVPKVEGIK